ncbi:MAG: beta-hydroxyacyl-ACP dehydratase [Bacteroidales bacterium]|nr:beta-hydroxyacyl-ACP dehydratase [Bacteroidales bacterium]
MKYLGEDILRLIPQRNPMIMIDEFEPLDGECGRTALTVRSDNLFITPFHELSETGMIEHIAQSCSALAGYQSLQRETIHPPIGLIAEVKHFSCARRPRPSEKMVTTVTFHLHVGAMVMAHGTTTVNHETIAEAQLKIFVQ